MTFPSIPDYTFRVPIGDGSTGRVYAAEYGGQSLMALKAFDSDAINRQLISDALVKIFNRAEHPGIVAVHDFDLASAQAYMSTGLHGEAYQTSDGQEAFRPRTIQGIMGHLIAEDAWEYCRQIADALAFLHRNRVLHCNLEPSNVLLDNSTPPHIKLTDFSQGLVGSVTKLIPGDSVFYAAPEQIRQPEHYFGGRAERWDVYAFGVLSYQLLTGKLPRLGAAHEEIKKREAAALDVHFSYDYRVLADMVEDQESFEWPGPAADEDESARRAIIERCLEVKPERRFPDMREVDLAFRALDDERDRREEHRKIAETQLRSDKQVSGLKKICAALGVLALGGLGGVAYFGTKSPAPPAVAPEPSAPPPKIEPVPDVSVAELAEMKSLLSNAMDSLGESQSALDEIVSLVISRDHDGNSQYDLPEDTRGLLLNYYEEFASQHQANPNLAEQVAKAESNAGEIHLSLGDGDAALSHLQTAVDKIEALRARSSDDVHLKISTARFLRNLSEAQALVGLSKAAADSAMRSNQLWNELHQANPTSSQATRALASSLLYLGQRMLEIERPADTGLHVQRAKTILEGLEASGEIAEEDLVALSRCDFLLGLSERAKGNLSDAIDLQIEAVDRLLNVKIASPEAPRSQLYSLATYYGELADALAEDGNREDSAIANKEAHKLLVDLVDEAPTNTAYHFELSRRFATKAALLRDAGEGEEARAAQEKAISIVRDILKVHPKRYDIVYELALQLGDMMELYAEGKMTNEVRTVGYESVKTMAELLRDDVDLEDNEGKRAHYRLAYGDLLIRWARQTEKVFADKPGTIDYYEKGIRQLELAFEAGIGSDEDQELIEFAQGRIKALGG